MKRLFVLASIIFACSTAFAQTQDTIHVSSGDRASAFLNSYLQRLSDRTQEFNLRVTEINKVRPFDVANLDTNAIETTVSKVLEFTEFLKSFLATTDSMQRNLEDSLAILHDLDPNPDLQRSLDAFETSYKTDQQAFRTYVAALQEVYQNVLDALLFVKSSQYKIDAKGLQFATSAEVSRYREFMTKVDRLTAGLQKASAASRKATAEANKQLQALNKLHAQEAARINKRANKAH